MLNGRQIGQCFLEKDLDRAHLGLRNLSFPKYMILKPIYELTGPDLGASFLVMPDLYGTGGHSICLTSFPRF